MWKESLLRRYTSLTQLLIDHDGSHASTLQVDNDFFLVAVPIVPFDSETFVSFFPKANRDGVVQNVSDIKKQLSKVGKEGWNMQSLVADFHLLLFIANSGIFNMDEDFPLICQSVLNKEIPLNEGYVLILRSIAGMD
jgi:nuclear protein localization protein 4 homolog